MNDTTETGASETYRLVSYNRPLTRAARRELMEYGLLDEEAVHELGRWTVATVEEMPPEDVLYRHELADDDEC